MGNFWHIGGVIVASVALIGGLAWWFNVGGAPSDVLLTATSTLAAPLSKQELAITNPGMTNAANRIAVFDTSLGTFKVELFEDTMPITTANFAKLAESGFYNDTKFHRVIENFMIQGGDPNSKGDDRSAYGTGGPGYTIPDEFVSGPLLSNTRGTIAMANTGQPNSGGSQFFINTVDNTQLDFDKEPSTSKHAVFGRVVEGMDVVDAISRVATDAHDAPVDPVVVNSITIESAK
jgi:peptidylprolyl isomerase